MKISALLALIMRMEAGVLTAFHLFTHNVEGIVVVTVSGYWAKSVPNNCFNVSSLTLAEKQSRSNVIGKRLQEASITDR